MKKRSTIFVLLTLLLIYSEVSFASGKEGEEEEAAPSLPHSVSPVSKSQADDIDVDEVMEKVINQTKQLSLKGVLADIKAGVKLRKLKKFLQRIQCYTDPTSGNEYMGGAQYTIDLKLKEGRIYEVGSSQEDLDLVNIAYGWTKSFSEPSFPNHMFAQAVFYYEDDRVYPRRLTTNNFSFYDGADKKISIPREKVIDWASNSSTINLGSRYHKRISSTGNGHSELQFIEDFRKAWYKNPSEVEKLFIPSGTQAGDVYMSGIEFFSSFDSCPTCLHKLVEFRRYHQEGQQSISQKIRDTLGSRFKGADEDALVLIFQSRVPYKDRKSAIYGVFDPKTKIGEGNCMFWHYDFGINYKGFEAFEDFQGFLLSKQPEAVVAPNIVYNFIHQVDDKESPYIERKPSDDTKGYFKFN